MKSLLIGVTGGSGSGKTTFIRELKERFTGQKLCVISQDDYYRPQEEVNLDEQGVHNYDEPSSIDHKAFLADLHKLQHGEVVCRPEYTFNNPEIIPQMIELKPAPIIIVEGVFVFHYKEIRELCDIKIYLHAKENLKVIRRIKRDQVERNYPLDDVLYRYEHHVLPTYEKYIKPYMEEADLIVNNNRQFDMGLEVISGYLSNYLSRN